MEETITNNAMHPDKMAPAQRLGELAMLRHRVRHASRGKKREFSQDNLLGLTHPARPDGARRAEREHVPDAPARLGGEPPLALVGLDELRRTVIRMVARRAAAILQDVENGTEEHKG